jgi:ribosomal-protein-alanine N-acetyltransferase
MAIGPGSRGTIPDSSVFPAAPTRSCALIHAVRRPALLRRTVLARVPGHPWELAPAEPPDDDRVLLRVLERADREEFLALARDSRDLHRPWTYPPERADQFEELYSRSRRDDTLCLLACLRDGGEIAGVLILSQIVRGAFQSAYLGYYAHQRYAGLGYMREAIAQTVEHAFGPLALHRIEANIQPANVASVALARSAGFRLEGFSPRYLLIGGQWRDHERYAITADDRD